MENCSKKREIYEIAKKKANQSLSVGCGGLILTGTQTSPQQSTQKTIQMKFQLVFYINSYWIFLKNHLVSPEKRSASKKIV